MTVAKILKLSFLLNLFRSDLGSNTICWNWAAKMDEKKPWILVDRQKGKKYNLTTEKNDF